MDAIQSVLPAEGLPETRKAALISLLGDEDPAVYQAVREKILSFGDTSRQWLRPHTLSSDPLIRRRSQDIIRHFEGLAADNRFLAFCLQQGQDLDLERGAWLLAQTRYPDANLEAYSALLDAFAAELRQRMPVQARAQSILTVINGYLFGELRLAGNEQNYYDPENSYLNRVLDRRTGNPINLCLVYLLIARRLQLPIVGIGLPGHFLCRYQSPTEEIYIDAFDKGKLMTKADCVHYLVRGNYDLRDEYLAPVSARRLLTRICGNLHQINLRQKAEEEMTRFQRYLIALGR
jgi:regulator of sirC expression with transglutaminase-like and TPR domain